MKKPISPTVHGILDYSTAAATALAPHLLGFPRRVAAAAYGVAGTIAALASMTDYEPGLERVVPFPVHGAVDAAMALALPALPRMLGFGENRRARRFFLGLTMLTATVTMMTRWTGRG